VFEVRSSLADITWKVNIANKKSETSSSEDPDENSTSSSTDLDTADTRIICKNVNPVGGLPNLAYLFLEREDSDKSKVTGRLHVIGNEGDFANPAPPDGVPSGLWSDDWYDSAGDGPVQAIVKPKAGGGPLRDILGVLSAADFKYLSYGTAAPQAGSAASITAMPAWVVIACPDYTPIWATSCRSGISRSTGVYTTWGRPSPSSPATTCSFGAWMTDWTSTSTPTT
jgi:hypothetical protein